METFIPNTYAAWTFVVTGGVFTVASTVFFAMFCKKLISDWKDFREGQRWAAIFIFCQELSDFVYAVVQFMIWLSFCRGNSLQEEDTLNIITVCCIYTVLLIIFFFALRDCLFYRSAGRYDVRKDIIIYLFFFTFLIVGVVLATMKATDRGFTHLILLQVITFLLSFSMLLANIWRTQFPKMRAASNQHFYNWMVFLVLISADLLFGLCFEYLVYAQSPASRAVWYFSRVAELMLQLMAVVNYKFYLEWLKCRNRGTDQDNEPLL